MVYTMNEYGTCEWKIHIHPVQHQQGTLALVSIEVGNILHLRGIRIVEYKGTMEVIYPSYKDHNGNFKDFFYVGDADKDRKIRDFIIQCYLKKGRK